MQQRISDRGRGLTVEGQPIFFALHIPKNEICGEIKIRIQQIESGVRVPLGTLHAMSFNLPPEKKLRGALRVLDFILFRMHVFS
jgi:hypothetical protein